jgi:hypothetical protein
MTHGMTTLRPWPSLVLLTVAALAMGCGKLKSSTPDASSNDAGNTPCTGIPVVCVQGGPMGSGISCNSSTATAACVGGEWACPKGTVDVTKCNCGAPGLECPGAHEICTADGWACAEGGVDGGLDADAGDASTDGASCGDGPNPGCWAVAGMTSDNLVICGDFGKNATCVGGQWTCAPGEVHGASCTCTMFAPPGCNVCTAHGWTCPDGGADGDAASFGD